MFSNLQPMRTKEMQVETLEKDFTTFVKTSILSYFVILQIPAEQMGFLLCTVFIDSFFGAIKSVRIGERFDKGKLVWGIIKKISILFIPFILAWFGLKFNMNLLYVIQAFIYIIAANDVISIVANIGTIYTGKEYKNVDFIEKGIHLLIDWLTALTNGIIQKFQIMVNAIKDQNPNKPKP